KVSRFLRAAAPALVVLAAMHASFMQAGEARDAASSPIVELTLAGEVEPAMAEYIAGGIETANRQKASLILIRMDTPGGLDESIRAIIRHVLDSAVPVAVSVSPAGARAASAGFFILLAADIAAMAPGTHTGAASPVAAIGGYPVTLDQTMANKILNDATA